MSLENARNLSLEEMDKQSFLHPYTPLKDHVENGPTIVASAKGVYITDTKGKEYIDSMAGLWCVNIGWGRDEESWSLGYQTIYGDPSGPAVWGDLEAYLNTPWHHPRGVELPVRSACIDTGGHHTSAVYSFVKPREGRRVFAIKGVGGEGRALVGRPSKNNVGNVEKPEEFEKNG